MKLVQKVFPAKTTEFELTDVSVRITTKSLMSESSYEVPLAELKPTPSFHRNISPLWLGIAVFFYLFSAVALGGIIYPVEGTERLGFIILFLVVFAFAVRATMVFLNTKMDVVLWSSALTGGAVIVMHRRRPTSRHVDEFTEMIVEKLRGVRSSEEEKPV